MKNGLKEEVQCVFFAMIKKKCVPFECSHAFYRLSCVGHKKIGAAKTNWTKIGAAEKVGSQKKNELLRVSGEK